MNPISRTAYYCCGVRMEDAKKKDSLCKDVHAKKFMNSEGLEIFEPFKPLKMANISNITRCKLIDNFINSELTSNSEINIVTIGAGFDTRPYRINGGNWIELDEEPIITFKNRQLPIDQCSNPLKRIAIDFSEESIQDKLKEINHNIYTLIIIEGVFLYLEREEINKTLKEITRLFPQHNLYCDLMNKPFFNKFGKRIHKRLTSMGSDISERPSNPQSIFDEHNYKLINSTPILNQSTKFNLFWKELKIPNFIIKFLINAALKDLKGYTVNHFRYNK